MVAIMVRKKPASWGCFGQTILVRLSFQAQKPTAVPSKLAMSVIFQAAMKSPLHLLTPRPKFNAYFNSPSGRIRPVQIKPTHIDCCPQMLPTNVTHRRDPTERADRERPAPGHHVQ